jgi:hypothetical protein
MAEFIHQNNALRLTFAKITYLRDTSCNINGTAIWEYVAGSNRVKAALYVGWRKNIANITYIEDEIEPGLEDKNDASANSGHNQQMCSVSFEV